MNHSSLLFEPLVVGQVLEVLAFVAHLLTHPSFAWAASLLFGDILALECAVVFWFSKT
jgi:hypothetical protein